MPIKLPTAAFDLGTIVYLKVNAERTGMVTGYVIRPGNVLTYLVTWDEPVEEMGHHFCELTDEKSYGDVESKVAQTA